MNGYLIGMLIGLPGLLAGFLLLNRNRAFQQALVLLFSIALLASGGWALSVRNASFAWPTGIGGLNLPLAVGANLVVLAMLAYWSQAWKIRLGAVLLVIQAFLLGWIGYSGRGASHTGVAELDHLALLLLLLVNVTGAMLLPFSLKYMERREQRRGFANAKRNSTTLLATAGFMLSAMNGLLLANHLLWLLFFWQALVLAGFRLVAHDRTKLAFAQGRKFVQWHLLGSAVFLAGTVGLQALAQTLTISELLVFNDANLLLLPIACLVLACLAGASLLPFQAGLLHSVVAPMPVSILLQAVTLVNAAIYLLIRISPLLMNTWLAKIIAVIGTFSFAAAALLALLQPDEKRILGFSTISCAGLAMALISLANLQAIYAAVLLTLLHGLTKALLLFGIGSDGSSRLSLRLEILAAVTMGMPPFGIPLMQWTALEAVMQNPVALLFVAAGITFTLLYCARYIVLRLNSVEQPTSVKLEPLYAVPQFVAAIAIVLLGLFSVPFTNWLIAPVLRENFHRFSDIAQGEASSFLIRDWLGINPVLVLAGLAGIVVLGWLLLRCSCRRPVEKPSQEHAGEMNGPTETATAAIMEVTAETHAEKAAADDAGELAEKMAETVEATSSTTAAETAEESLATETTAATIPTRPAFSIIPLAAAPTIQLYATVIAGALIILMFEVVIR